MVFGTDQLPWRKPFSLICHGGTHLKESWSSRYPEVASQAKCCPFHAFLWRNTPRRKLMWQTLWTGFSGQVLSFSCTAMEEHTSKKVDVADTLNWLLRPSAVLFMLCSGGTHLEESWSGRHSELASQAKCCLFHALSWRNTPQRKLKWQTEKSLTLSHDVVLVLEILRAKLGRVKRWFGQVLTTLTTKGK